MAFAGLIAILGPVPSQAKVWSTFGFQTLESLKLEASRRLGVGNRHFFDFLICGVTKGFEQAFWP